MASWKVVYRARKSPYVLGLQKRRGVTIGGGTTTVTFSGASLTTRPITLRAFKKLYNWAVVISLRKVR